MAQFKSKRDQVNRLIEKLEKDKEGVLVRLQKYEDSKMQKDESWKQYAAELKSIVDKVEIIQNDRKALNRVIEGLETVIRMKEREVESKNVALSRESLQKILENIYKTEEKIAAEADLKDASRIQLENIVEKELKSKKEKGENAEKNVEKSN